VNFVLLCDHRIFQMKKQFIAAIFLAFSAVHLFAAGKQLTGQHAPANSPALSPVDAQKVFSVPPGFEVRLFAAEPDVVNPVAMTWDERGRLWVLELYEYPLGAPAGQKGRDRIKILEDTDNDGVADKVTVWADGLNLATGLLLGNGGAYVGQAPDLLFLEDTNHDDKADKRTVLLTGFGLNDRHELLNGFTWGPDGQLYMTHGVFNASKIKIPEATTPGVTMSAAVARFDPRTKKFEILADGTSNPWGVDFDKYGNAFVSACVIDHLLRAARRRSRKSLLLRIAAKHRRSQTLHGGLCGHLHLSRRHVSQGISRPRFHGQHSSECD
jgi:putative membrane-bound dehydrogenase-like protein